MQEVLGVDDIFPDYREIKRVHKYILVINSLNEVFLFKEYPKKQGEVLKRLFLGQKKAKEVKLSKIIDYKTINNSIYTIEEWHIGITLSEYLKTPILNEDIEYFIKEMIKNIYFLKTLDIIHKDIKPDNIIILKNGNNKFDFRLIDYNIARIYSPEKSKDTSINGTEGYIAPEQRGAEQTTSKSDIYSFGKTLEDICRVNKCNNYIKGVIEISTEFDPNKRPDVEDLIQESKFNQERYQKKRKNKLIILLVLLGIFNLIFVNSSLEEYNPQALYNKFQLVVIVTLLTVLLYLFELIVYSIFHESEQKFVNFLNQKFKRTKFLKNTFKVIAYTIIYYLYFFIAILVIAIIFSIIQTILG